MVVAYDTATKSARMSATVLQFDIDGPPAFIEICSAAYAAVLVVITLGDPSFTVAADVATMAGAPKSGVAGVAGTAAAARIKSGGGTVKVNNLTVGTSGADINLSAVVTAVGQTVTLTAGTLTHAT